MACLNAFPKGKQGSMSRESGGKLGISYSMWTTCEFCPSAALGTVAGDTQGFPGGVICCV